MARFYAEGNKFVFNLGVNSNKVTPLQHQPW
jgi:hypothetical protein